MFISHSFTRISGKRLLQTVIEYLHRKLLTANFLSYDIESARKKVHLLDLHWKKNNTFLVLLICI
jgi:hypothetical protein